MITPNYLRLDFRTRSNKEYKEPSEDYEKNQREKM